MILLIDNTKRKVRYDIRRVFLSHGQPCALTDIPGVIELMPAKVIAVTERYLFADASFISSRFGHVPVLVIEKPADAEEVLKIHAMPPSGKISRVRYTADSVIFCGKPLYLTRKERMILNLMLIYPENRFTREFVSAYCLEGKSGVEVHICNINTKARNSTGFNLIDCERYTGYCLNKI